MRLLHVYAGPYPTYQGTQALVGQICRLLSRAGHDVHLLCYAHRRYPADEPFTVHRLTDFPPFTVERSGWSWRKLLLDGRLMVAVRRLTVSLRPAVVHAHHYEALLAGWSADPLRAHRLVFHCHSLMEPELAGYLSPHLRTAANRLGRLGDQWLPRLADRVVAIGPNQRKQLMRRGVAPEKIVVARPPIDLPLTNPTSPAEVNGSVTAVYCGNLDAYQGLDSLLDGLGQLDHQTRASLRVRIVTDSETTGFDRELDSRGLGSFTRTVPHGSVAQAMSELQSADIALVPRQAAGGVPIKLINALGKSRAVLMHRALVDGLVPGRDVWAIDMGQPAQVSQALTRLTTDAGLRRRLSMNGRVAAQHLYDPANTLRTIETLYGDLVR